MDAGFLAEMPVREIPLNPHGDAFQAGFFARHGIQDFRLISFALGVSQVHAEEHLRPVLRLGSSGAGMNREQRVAAVILFEEQGLKLRLFKVRCQGCQGALEISADVLSFRGQLGQNLDLFFFFLKAGKSADLALELLLFLLEVLRLLTVLPSLWCRKLSGDRGEIGAFSL